MRAFLWGLLSTECFVNRHKLLRCKIGKKDNQKSAVSTEEGAILFIFLMFLFALKLYALDDAADKAKSEQGKKDVVSQDRKSNTSELQSLRRISVGVLWL